MPANHLTRVQVTIKADKWGTLSPFMKEMDTAVRHGRGLTTCQLEGGGLVLDLGIRPDAACCATVTRKRGRHAHIKGISFPFFQWLSQRWYHGGPRRPDHATTVTFFLLRGKQIPHCRVRLSTKFQTKNERQYQHDRIFYL
jgi:hypothetical protein